MVVTMSATSKPPLVFASVAHAFQRVRGAGGHLGVYETLERRLVGLDCRLDRHLCEEGVQRRLIRDEN